jgi:hypothetical protein
MSGSCRCVHRPARRLSPSLAVSRANPNRMNESSQVVSEGMGAASARALGSSTTFASNTGREMDGWVIKF